MGRGKRQGQHRQQSQAIQLGSSNGRTRLAPVIRPPEPLISADVEQLMAAALVEAGLLREHLDDDDLDRVAAIFTDTGGDDEARVNATVSIFTGELLAVEEETECCDRCSKIVRAGHGLFYPEDDPDQERLCLSCHVAAVFGT